MGFQFQNVKRICNAVGIRGLFFQPCFSKCAGHFRRSVEGGEPSTIVAGAALLRNSVRVFRLHESARTWHDATSCCGVAQNTVSFAIRISQPKYYLLRKASSQVCLHRFVRRALFTRTSTKVYVVASLLMNRRKNPRLLCKERAHHRHEKPRLHTP